MFEHFLDGVTKKSKYQNMLIFCVFLLSDTAGSCFSVTAPDIFFLINEELKYNSETLSLIYLSNTKPYSCMPILIYITINKIL